MQPVITPAITQSCVVQLAAAAARRHPSLIEGCCGPVDVEAPRIVQRWAATLSSDMRMEFNASYNGSFAVCLFDLQREGTVLRPAFERANAIRAGLGMELVTAIDELSYRYGLVLTPASLFGMTSNYRWYGETDQKQFVKAYMDNCLELGDKPTKEQLEEAAEIGPDAYFDNFPGMPKQVVLNWRFQRRNMRPPRADAKTYWRQAGQARTDWECELLLALSAMADFADARFGGVYELMNNAGVDHEQGLNSYYFAWDESDEMGYWADEVFNELWNDGLASDALLQFDFNENTRNQVDDLVTCVEACCDHHNVMDQVLEVLRKAAEESNAG